MKILITGGAGFVGSHLCDSYVDRGATVLCYDNFLNGSLFNIRHLLNKKNFKLINGDIRDFDLLEKIVRDVDVVFHLAAQIHVDRSIIEPKLTYDINVTGTLNILEIARIFDVQNIVYASSSEVYGSAQHVPINEEHPLNAPHPYGASKIAADRLCHAYLQTYGMNICIMRSFNLYGPRQKDSGYGGAISLFMKRVLNNFPPIIYGDGSQTRDYLYIDDIIDAYHRVLDHSKELSGPVNFGTGREISIIDLANKIIRLSGKDLVPVHVGPRPGEVKRLVADISKAKTIGWKPKNSIDTGLKKLYEWYKNYRSEEWAKPG